MERLHRAATAPQAGGGMALDPQLIFLERASARLVLVEAGKISLDDAFDGLIPAFRDLAMQRDILERMERLYPHIRLKPKLRRVR